jgi:hypothetical protein
MVNISPSGDHVFGQSSPAAKADEIYSTFNKTTTALSSRSTQAAFSANCSSFCEKVQGDMVNGLPSGDDVFGQSPPAAKADEIYSTFDKTTTTLSSRST